LSPNPARDLTRLTEQLDLNAASLLPCCVPLGQVAPRASCNFVPMLNLASDNPAHLTQLTLRPDFPLPPRAQNEARKKFFSKKIETDSKLKWDFKKKFERSFKF
jgi:hypothetical protein